MTITILGAGLAGISCSYFIGHQQCVVFEKNSYAGGHIYTHSSNGCYWDEGPHVSFTKHQKVRDLLTVSTSCDLLEYQANVGNWYQGHWIPHPAQSNLYALPKSLAAQCLDDFLASRPESTDSNDRSPRHYGEWLEQAFGKTFARRFSSAYTRKYWTCDPEQLTTDWVGERVFRPDVETVVSGFHGPSLKNTHYITAVRYPSIGGFARIADGMIRDANIQLNQEVITIDMEQRIVFFADGRQHEFNTLINTLPLDQFVAKIKGVPRSIQEQCNELSCTSLLLINILAKNASLIPYHWLYVYDEDMYSTRITQTHLLSPASTPTGQAGIQVEVYSSRYRPFSEDHATIASKVLQEVQAMGLVDIPIAMTTQFIPHANIICDKERRSVLNEVLCWLERFGLNREYDDLHPMTDWSHFSVIPREASLILAGRFAQWKYYWTDDCILRGQQISNSFQ